MLSKHEEQAERRDVLENEKRLRASTLSQFAQSEAAEARGRFTAHEQSTVVGATPLPKYPQLPASSPWAGPDLVPTEPPLGYAIDELSALEPSSLPSPAQAPPNPSSQAPPLADERLGFSAYRRF
jgi:hypothetical protein